MKSSLLILLSLFSLSLAIELVQFSDTIQIGSQTVQGQFISINQMLDSQDSQVYQDMYVCFTGQERDVSALEGCVSQTEKLILWVYQAPRIVKVTNDYILQAPVEILLGDDVMVEIIPSETEFVRKSVYCQPKLIRVDESKTELFKTGESAVVKHSRVFNCWVLQDSAPGQLTLLALWAVLFVLWMLNTYCFNKMHASFLQKMLFLIPLLSLISYTFETAIFLGCPGVFYTIYYYIQMILLSTNILFSSVLIGLLMLIASGWTLLQDTITRHQLTTIILFMGIIYVVQSATAVGANLSFFHYIIVPIQDLVYVLIYLLILANMRRNIKFLKIWRSTPEIQQHYQLRRALSAKIKLLTCLLLFISLYFVQFIIFDFVNLFYVKLYFQRSVTRFVIQGFFQFVALSVILFLMRAKEEMRFFSLDLTQLQHNRQAFVIPIYKTIIRQKEECVSEDQDNDLQEPLIPVNDEQPLVLVYPSERLSSDNVTQHLKIATREIN